MEISRGGVELSESFWELMIKLNKEVGSQGFSNRHMKNWRLQWRLRFPYMESNWRLGPLYCRLWLAAMHLWRTSTLDFPGLNWFHFVIIYFPPAGDQQICRMWCPSQKRQRIDCKDQSSGTRIATFNNAPNQSHFCAKPPSVSRGPDS